MEHRLSERQSVQVEATVRLRNGLMMVGETRNVSRYGVLLDAAGELPSNTFVQVVLGADGGPRHPPIAGVVVHSSSRGAGIMFVNECDVDALQRVDRAA